MAITVITCVGGGSATAVPGREKAAIVSAATGTTTTRDKTFIDFGDDQLTVGRPHPMIDPSLRLDRLARELVDDECAVVLLDVVLGGLARLESEGEQIRDRAALSEVRQR